MKRISFLLFCVILITGFLNAQDYKITHKEWAIASSKPKYQFEFTYPQIVSSQSNVTGMKMFNNHIYNIVSAMSDTFRVWMADWDTITTDHKMGSYYEAWDSVYYTSGKIVSVLFFESYYFSGAAHPNNSAFSVNYDTENYKEFALSDLLTSGWEKKISEYCISDLVKQKKAEYGIDPTQWVKEGAGPEAKNFKVYNITTTGLWITFPTYQVGPYVEGPSEVFIPYAEIKSIIKPGGILGEVMK